MRVRFLESRLAVGMAALSAVALGVAAYGMILIPGASGVSFAAAAVVLIAYGVTARVVVPKIEQRNAATADVALWAGLAAGTVFALEVSLEYLLLPRDNTTYGAVEFGTVFLIYFCAGAGLTLMKQRALESATGAAVAGMLSSLIWCIFVLATFYLFLGTSRQEQVLRAEGDYDDFRRSGMGDLHAFLLEDFFGATFFHLLLAARVGSKLFQF